MISFDIKRGANVPALQGYLDFGDGRDLSDVATVNFKVADSDGNVLLDNLMTIVSATTNEVKYVWLVGDTDTAGHYWGEIWATFNNGDVFKIPAGDEYIDIRINEDLPNV